MADLLETCIDDIIRDPEAVPMAMEEAGPSGAHASASPGVAVDDVLGHTGEGRHRDVYSLAVGILEQDAPPAP